MCSTVENHEMTLSGTFLTPQDFADVANMIDCGELAACHAYTVLSACNQVRLFETFPHLKSAGWYDEIVRRHRRSTAAG